MTLSTRVLVPLLVLCGLGSSRAAAPAVRTVKDVTFLEPARAEKLDLYLPEPPAAGKLSPGLVWIHGGGWMGGEKGEARAREICGTLAQAGYVAVSINYKLGAGAWPTNLHDCKNGVRFLRAHAAEYHLDPARIAVAGGSAGGHLALMVAFTTGRKDLEPEAPYAGLSSAVGCVIDMYGPTDILTRKATSKSGEPRATRKLMGKSLEVFRAASDEADVLRYASPVTHVNRNSPPVLILHGHADPTVDYEQSEELARTLKQHGVEHEFILLEGIGHTFDWESWNKKPLPRDLRPVALDFLSRHLRLDAPAVPVAR